MDLSHGMLPKAHSPAHGIFYVCKPDLEPCLPTGSNQIFKLPCPLAQTLLLPPLSVALDRLWQWWHYTAAQQTSPGGSQLNCCTTPWVSCLLTGVRVQKASHHHTVTCEGSDGLKPPQRNLWKQVEANCLLSKWLQLNCISNPSPL